MDNNCCILCGKNAGECISYDNKKNEEGEGFWISKSNYCLWASFDGGTYEIGPLLINYCPICGRDLREARKLEKIKKDFE